MAFDPTRFMEGLPQIKPENAHEQGPVRSMNDKFRVPISFLPPLEDREDYKAGVAAEREACAKLVESQQCYGLSYIDKALVSVARKIRARGK